MSTKKDLQMEVDRLNAKYCKNTKNHLVISKNIGGYAVELEGKYYKRGNKYFKRKGSISGAASIGQDWHDTATNTLAALHKADSRGLVKEKIRFYEKNK